MNTVFRNLTSFTIASMITLALFALMHQLVRFDPGPTIEETRIPQFQFRQVIPETPETPPPVIPEPELEKPKPLPPVPEKAIPVPAEPKRTPIDIARTQGTGAPVYTGDPSGPGTGGGSLTPLVRVEPIYPQRAALSGLSGEVEVVFTVTETGAVVNARILASRPARIFDSAALNAIVKWRFQPRTIGGEPVRVRATQTFRFTLDD